MHFMIALLFAGVVVGHLPIWLAKFCCFCCCLLLYLLPSWGAAFFLRFCFLCVDLILAVSWRWHFCCIPPVVYVGLCSNVCVSQRPFYSHIFYASLFLYIFSLVNFCIHSFFLGNMGTKHCYSDSRQSCTSMSTIVNTTM